MLPLVRYVSPVRQRGGLPPVRVLLHRIHDTADFAKRVRILRNLVAASQDEIRPENFGKLAADVWAVIVDGDLTAVTAFNTAQIEDETLKQDFLAAHPELTSTVQELEDHDVLRGSLMVFELDAGRLPGHASRFAALMANSDLWTPLTGHCSPRTTTHGPTTRRTPTSASSAHHRWRTAGASSSPERPEAA